MEPNGVSEINCTRVSHHSSHASIVHFSYSFSFIDSNFFFIIARRGNRRRQLMQSERRKNICFLFRRLDCSCSCEWRMANGDWGFVADAYKINMNFRYCAAVFRSFFFFCLFDCRPLAHGDPLFQYCCCRFNLIFICCCWCWCCCYCCGCLSLGVGSFLIL